MGTKPPHFLWSLYNIETKELIEGLVREEVVAIVSRLATSSRLLWLVWREDWSKWKVVTTLPELFKKPIRVLQHSSPPIPLEYQDYQESSGLNRTVTEILDQDLMVNDERMNSVTNVEVIGVSPIPGSFSQEEKMEFIHRAYPRLKKKYEILIDCNGKKFRSTSIDISVGGLLLENPLPEWIFGYCTITIFKPSNGESVQLTCSIVENQPPQARYRVALSPLKLMEDQNRFYLWLSAS